MTGNSAHSTGLRRLVEMAGPGGGDLAHGGGPWTRAAGAADALRTDLGRVRSELAVAHEGVGAGTAALGMAGVLRAVRESWEQRIRTATDECGELAGSLRAVAKIHGEVDTSVRSSLEKIAVPPKAADAPGVGAGA
jgi:hypothetical protein